MGGKAVEGLMMRDMVGEVDREEAWVVGTVVVTAVGMVALLWVETEYRQGHH